MKKALFDDVSIRCAKLTTRKYSTSFSMGIYFLDRKYHNPIYSIYGFVRYADEIVDSFDGYDQAYLLDKFKKDTYEAIEQKISLNPILNAYQHVVNEYGIEKELTDTFLESMTMDLDKTEYNREGYDTYILGSAEVVGLMCLRVFTEGNNEQYESLKPSAMRLGAAFQKVNFLRDAGADFEELGRTYFPGVDLSTFLPEEKQRIEQEIAADFDAALEGIKRLPIGARRGVYTAYVYYRSLFRKIKSVPAERVLQERIRIHNLHKLGLTCRSLLQHRLNNLTL
ncbi:MAG: phytoene/squalene synthase family protein [Saprospiraceae bacterium]